MFVNIESTVKMAAIMSSLNKKEKIFKQKMLENSRKNKHERENNAFDQKATSLG